MEVGRSAKLSNSTVGGGGLSHAEKKMSVLAPLVDFFFGVRWGQEMTTDVSLLACEFLAAWELEEGLPPAMNALWAAVLLALGVTGVACGARCGTGVASVSSVVLGAAVGDIVASSSALAYDCDMRSVFVVGSMLLSLICVFALRACATIATTTVAAIGVAAFWRGVVPPLRRTPSEFTFYNQPIFPFWAGVCVSVLGCGALVAVKRVLMEKVVSALVSGLSVGVGVWHAGIASGHRVPPEVCASAGAGAAAIALVVVLRASLRAWCRRCTRRKTSTADSRDDRGCGSGWRVHRARASSSATGTPSPAKGDAPRDASGGGGAWWAWTRVPSARGRTSPKTAEDEHAIDVTVIDSASETREMGQIS